ncbi:pilus assembly protein FimV [Gammaproteobacteria bacterium]
MYRRLSLVVAVSTALAPWSAHALGLGDIRVNSALNQPLNAEIDLQSVEDTFVLDDLRAAIPSDKAFSRAGVERSYVLTQLIFTPGKTPDGRSVLGVRSREPIREVFLDFLVEVVWPQGRVVKGYTILLDPPLGERRPLFQAGLPPVSGRPHEAAGDTGKPVEYGPIRSNDTLWGIVQHLGIRGATPHQVAVALWQHNPDAFVKGNINRLRVGGQLHLSQSQVVFERSHQDALLDYATARRAPSHLPLPLGASLSQPKPLRPAEPAPATAEATGKSSPPDQPAPPTHPAQAVPPVQPGLGVAGEELLTLRQENSELKTRIKGLEARVADLSRQPTQPVPPEVPPVAAPTMMPPPPPEAPTVRPPVAAPLPEVRPDAAPLPTGQAPSPTATPVTEPLVAESTPPSPTVLPMAEPVPPAPDVAWYEAILNTIASLIIEIINGILDNFVIAFAGLAALMGGAWFWNRHRKPVAEIAEDWEPSTEEPQLPRDSALDTAPMEPAADIPDTDSVSSRDSSFLQGFDKSSIDSALSDDTSEVDPINEADVYVAYGRYQQAEDILKQAVQRYPDRFPIKEKLLDIYATKSRNAKAFVELATSISASGLPDERPDLWTRVQTLGREIDPANPLFGGQVADGGIGRMGVGPASPSPKPGELAMGLDLDAPGGYSPNETPTTLMGDIDLGDLDLSELNRELELGITATPSVESTRPTPKPPDEADMGLDLGDLDLGDLEGGIEVDLTADEPIKGVRTPPSPAPTRMAAPTLNTLEDDLDLDRLLTEPEPPSPPPPSRLSLDDLGSDLQGGTVINVEDESRGDSGDDDISTKLDLARAYLEMDDPEGARELLEEVTRGGNSQQRAEAKSILAKIP